jgi:hypothetical protein
MSKWRGVTHKSDASHQSEIPNIGGEGRGINSGRQYGEVVHPVKIENGGWGLLLLLSPTAMTLPDLAISSQFA